MQEKPFAPRAWISRIQAHKLPVLEYSKQCLDGMRETEEEVTARHIVGVSVGDPLLAARMVVQAQSQRGQALHHDVSTITGAIMMMGINPFLRTLSDLKSVEGILEEKSPEALLEVMEIIRRARNAARYAYEWALWRVDTNIREIRLAALLHDLAEILLYVLEPSRALRIRALLKANPGMRSADAQMKVLDCRISELQVALCRAWKLPNLLLQLMDNKEAENPRVKNVILAVNFARHLANKDSEEVLSGDLVEIAALLNINVDALKKRFNLSRALEISQMPEVIQTSESSQMPRL
ncbi:MAG: HDOD domain-containing protein [Zoogloeaceae bacterium]|jgi:hypothetical protein|nr:HDOD domain-containing protein [Zoogloeaceae bacterium]